MSNIANNISVSFLSLDSDVTNFFKQVKKMGTWIHFDVMDNKFVNNTGVDIKYIKTAKNLGLYVDTHLMVEKPIGDKYVYDAISYGTDIITIHREIENFESVLNRLNELKKEHNIKIGVSVKLDTDVYELKKYENEFDLILLMSIEPGFGGQKYIERVNDKIKEAKKIFKDKIIQVDGGINFNTFLTPYTLGADSLVIGSYFAKSKNINASFIALEILVDFENIPKDSNIEFDRRLLQILPGGYGQNDILIGITSPNLRKFVAKWNKKINLDIIKYFLCSNIHEYRKFALFCMSNMAKKKETNLQELVNFMKEKIEYINNWDLTDEIAPNVLGKYLLTLSNKKIIEELDWYLNSSNFWIRRIGIVSCLMLAKNGYLDICQNVARRTMYDENHLIQKAIGWVLRESYKKNPKEILEFLKENNSKKKLPRFVISYACEKMTTKEKKEVKGEI